MFSKNCTFISFFIYLSDDTINKLIDGVESRRKVSFARYFIFSYKNGLEEYVLHAEKSCLVYG